MKRRLITEIILLAIILVIAGCSNQAGASAPDTSFATEIGRQNLEGASYGASSTLIKLRDDNSGKIIYVIKNTDGIAMQVVSSDYENK